MADVETLAERIQTVERAVTDGIGQFPEATTLADIETRIQTLETTVEEIDERTAELEAATQALRGYVGNIRSVNEDVEQRADAALAATERLEQELTGGRSASMSADEPEADRRTDQPTEGTAGPPGRTTQERSPVDTSPPRSKDRSTSRDRQHSETAAGLADSIGDTEDIDSTTDSDEPGLFASIRERL